MQQLCWQLSHSIQFVLKHDYSQIIRNDTFVLDPQESYWAGRIYRGKDGFELRALKTLLDVLV